MKSGVKIRIMFLAILLFYGINLKAINSTDDKVNSDYFEPEKITAVNDTFYFISGCGNLGFGENVMDNDNIPEGIKAKIQYVTNSENQFISFGINGNFAYQSVIGFNGTASFTYHICDENDISNSTEATVYIQIRSDNDCDGVFDIDDIDDDNDGIPDLVEGNGVLDTDGDGIPDSFDIDSDNDGIPDIREWQAEGNYVIPSGVDANANGWDDAFEKIVNPYKFVVVDSDNDKIPDYLDDDSDNDEITDFVEATDANFDSFPDFSFIYSDYDFDGLDDAFDNVRYWLLECNSIGSSVPIPDHDGNGISDFREKSASSTESNENNGTLDYSTSKITFQNPNNGLFSVNIQNYSNDVETHLKIYGLNGDLKADIIPTRSIVDLDLTSYQAGIYVIKIITPNLTCSKKLILQTGTGF